MDARAGQVHRLRVAVRRGQGHRRREWKSGSEKLAAALTGCFILIERHEEGAGAGGGWGDQRANSRGGDTVGHHRRVDRGDACGLERAQGWGDGTMTRTPGVGTTRRGKTMRGKTTGGKTSSLQRPGGGEDGAVDIDPNSMEFLDETFGLPEEFGEAVDEPVAIRAQLDPADSTSHDDLGWPDLDPLPSDVSDGDDVGWPALDPLAPMESIDDSLEDYLAGTPPPAGATRARGSVSSS